MAVSDGGVAAWLSKGDVERVVVVRGEGAYTVADSGPPGSIRDLAFTGSVLSWTHDGQPRALDTAPG